MTEDETVDWHHLLSGNEFEQTPGESEGQRSLLQFMGLQRVGHNLVTEQQDLNVFISSKVQIEVFNSPNFLPRN